MIDSKQAFQDSSILIISDNAIRNKILRNHYDSNPKKTFYITLNEESQTIPLSCFNSYLWSLNYIQEKINNKMVAEKLAGDYDLIYIQDIHFIDNESLKTLRNLVISGGNHVIASATVNGIMKNYRSIVEIVSMGFKIEYYGKIGENFYPLSFIHSISGNEGEVKFNVIPNEFTEKDEIMNNLMEEEVETIEETKEFLHIIPSLFIKSKYPQIYRKLQELIKRGVMKEDTFHITPVDSDILSNSGKRLTQKARDLIVSYAKEVNEKLGNKILSGILYYKAGLWNESASELRVVIDDLFKEKAYADIINTIETLMKISELTNRDNYVYAVALNYSGNTRRALKIFDNLVQTDYFVTNPDDVAEYVKIIFNRNGYDKANKILESFSGRMSRESLGRLYLDLCSQSINDGDEAHVDYLLKKAEENLGNGKEMRCEYERMRGNLCLMRKDMKSALSHYKESLELAKEIEDYGLMAKAFNNIGIMYSHDLKTAEGLKYFDESRRYALKIEDYSGYSITTANMIPLAIELGDEELSFKFLQEVEGVPRFFRDGIALSNAYYSISDVYLKRGDIAEAIDYLIKGINYSLEKSNNYEISYFLFKLAVLKLIIGQDPTLEIETARIYGDKYSEEYSYWESEVAFYSGDIEGARKYISKSFRDIESSGNKSVILEDGIRMNLYDALLTGKITRLDIMHIESKLPDINSLKIVIKYILGEKDFNTSEKELLSLESPFYYELGRAIISAVEGKSFITSYTGLMTVYSSIRKLFNKEH